MGQIAAALAKAQLEMSALYKDKVADVQSKKGAGSSYSYTYADLGMALEACRPALNTNGIAVTGGASASGNGVDVWLMLIHESGEFIRDTLRMPVSGNDAQAVASAITYGRRYLLLAMVGLAAEDDDGKRAHDSPPAAQEYASDVVREEVVALCDHLAVARSAPDKQVLGRVVFAAAWKAVALAPDPEAKPHNMTPAEGALVLAWLRSTAEKQARLEQQRGRERQPGDDDDHDPTAAGAL